MGEVGVSCNTWFLQVAMYGSCETVLSVSNISMPKSRGGGTCSVCVEATLHGRR